MRKDKLGGTFPGTRISSCPFISATNVSYSAKLIATSVIGYHPLP